MVNEYVKNHWDECLLGDERLTERAKLMGEKILEKPDCLIPQQMVTWSATKASYRFLDNPSVTYNDLITPHWKHSKDVTASYDTVLCIQDTSDISFTGHAAIEGMSQLGNGQGQGFLLHSTLAVIPNHQPLIIGLLHQEIYYRKQTPRYETQKDKYNREKESDVWINSLRAVGNPPSGTNYIDVMDRGADIFRVIKESISQGHNYIIRAAYNRKLENETKNLFDLIRDVTPMGTVHLAVKKRSTQKKRLALLTVASKKVTLLPPYPSTHEAPIACTVIYAKERRPPEGQEPIEWIILTSLDGTKFEESCKIIDLYAMRWVIEEYHKCLKTGCKLEQRQFKNSERIERLTGFLAVAAICLLHMREQMRTGQLTLAKEYIPHLMLEIVSKKSSIYAASMTLKQFWIEVAKMGGFLARKNDNDPGWITIWRGWNDLQKMCEGATIMNCG